jgi:hypothetical protein
VTSGAHAPLAATDPFLVVALIAAYNEADVIGSVVRDLVEQGVSVYLVDHHSTDGTLAAVEPYLGRGLLGVERFPPDGSAANAFTWERLLRRKEALAQELDAAWFLHTDADEFRESPWADLTLREAIRRVDAAGYNAIDSARFDFWPVGETARPGDDVRSVFRWYEAPPPSDLLQIRCWKKGDGPVDLASSGGHEARFEHRKVFPIRFIVRHYPIRSQSHGERKVFVERRARLLPEERARGWHVQYDGVHEGDSFVRDRRTLTAWDPDAVRLALVLGHRGVEELEEAVRTARSETAALARALEVARAELGLTRAELGRAQADLTGARAAQAGLSRRVEDLLASRSWRWTAPLRAAWRAVGGR